mmetsp:Transcript_3022/g.7940  ORF Transcript_3022/g.7940 Transcript_3022/m.7940 type:complete len:91 (-) Transcript_3022:12-284(-)
MLARLQQLLRSSCKELSHSTLRYLKAWSNTSIVVFGMHTTPGECTETILARGKEGGPKKAEVGSLTHHHTVRNLCFPHVTRMFARTHLRE